MYVYVLNILGGHLKIDIWVYEVQLNAPTGPCGRLLRFARQIENLPEFGAWLLLIWKCGTGSNLKWMSMNVYQ